MAAESWGAAGGARGGEEGDVGEEDTAGERKPGSQLSAGDGHVVRVSQRASWSEL